MTPSKIDRRQFLAGSLAAGAVGAVHRGLGKSAGRSLQAALTSSAASLPGGQVLVLVTMYGGNDGLNTVVPIGDQNYYQQRGSIAIAQNSALSIGQGFGFHPSLSGVKSLWDANQVAVVRGVGYPNPNYSHFASMDIWQGADPTGNSATGWIGRWLDQSPSNPLQSIWVGSNLPLAFVGKNNQASSVIPSTSPSSQLPNATPELRNFYSLLQRAHSYDSKLQKSSMTAASNMLSVSQLVSQALTKAPTISQNFPATAGAFGTELSLVAQLIAAGLPTRVYGVSLNGFDSHAGEVASYATLLKQLDSGISGFFTSLQDIPNGNDVVMLVYTEFGRRVAANASGGTDHGSGNSAFVIGSPVIGGLYGEQPSLTALDSNGSLVVTTDFRAVYATILEKVLGSTSTEVLHGQFAGVPFL